jgi:hypothetical protein
MSKRVFYCEMPYGLQEKARDALRRELELCPDWRTDNLAADAVIEQVWNALVGHDSPPEPVTKTALKQHA